MHDNSTSAGFFISAEFCCLSLSSFSFFWNGNSVSNGIPKELQINTLNSRKERVFQQQKINKKIIIINKKEGVFQKKKIITNFIWTNMLVFKKSYKN